MNVILRRRGFSAVFCALALMVLGGVTWRVTSTMTQSRRSARPMQCGHFALLRVCQLLGVITLEKDVLAAMPPKALGHSFTDLRLAAERMNLQTEGFVEDWPTLMTGQVPAILQLRNPDHFVVLSRADGDQPIIFDDIGKRRAVTAHSIRRRWSGAVLRLSKRDHTTGIESRLGVERVPRIQFDTLIIDQGQLAH